MKKIILTGSASGFGLLTAKTLVKQGHTVYATMRNINGANAEPAKALKNLKPADLLFFASGKNSNPNARVTHVAMYIGNGEFIHSAGTVRINSMLKDAANYDDFQTRTVVAAKRYIGVDDPQIQTIKNNPYYK